MSDIDRLLFLVDTHGDLGEISTGCEICDEMQELKQKFIVREKLQELVKERIKFLQNTTITLGDDKYLHGQEVIQNTLQSLVEESQK